MALPWGVKEEVAADAAEAVTAYMESVQGTELQLTDGTTINLMKAGVKERKGTYTLIYRYQIA